VSLTDALLLEGYRDAADVWISDRTDALGSGTQADPFSGATREGREFLVSLTNDQSTAATAREALATTSLALGLVDGDVVTVRNAVGTDAEYWNGSFPVYGVSGTSFKYWMKRKDSVLSPGKIQPPTQASQPPSTAARLTFHFDEVMRKLAALPNTFINIHISAGTFQTRGYSDSALVAGRPQIWLASRGMKIRGSGIDVSVLKLVYADVQDGNYYAIGSTYGRFLDYVEVSDLTVDSNLPCQPVSPPFGGHPGRDYAAVACSAVALAGAFCRISGVKAIHWGTQSTTESFVLFVGGGHPDFPNNPTTNGIIEDCICVEPNENNRYTASIICNFSGADPPGFRHSYSRGGIVRRNFVDCIFSGGRSSFPPIVTSSAAAALGPGETDQRVWIITTAAPHGKTAGDRVFISDPIPFSPWTDYFEIQAFDSGWPDNPENLTKFKITFAPNKNAPSGR